VCRLHDEVGVAAEGWSAERRSRRLWSRCIERLQSAISCKLQHPQKSSKPPVGVVGCPRAILRWHEIRHGCPTNPLATCALPMTSTELLENRAKPLCVRGERRRFVGHLTATETASGLTIVVADCVLGAFVYMRIRSPAIAFANQIRIYRLASREPCTGYRD
jgi:hypothetical protein